jgi:hypothetical protein
MKPQLAPHVPGNTEAERMSNAVRKMFSVPKEAILKAEAKWKQAQTFKKKRPKKPS